MKLNIAYSCDEAYVHHTGISMISLFENNKDIEQIEIFFIAKEVSDESLLTLRGIAEKHKRLFSVVPFNSICYDLDVKDTGRHIETIYAKLFFTRIPKIDKIIYLDSDTIVAGSLKELCEIKLGDNFFAGVNARAINPADKLNLKKSDPFINDGVVFINLEECRKHNILEKFKEFIAQHNGNPPLLSEGVINKVCTGKIKVIHPKFNLMSSLIEFKGNRFASIDSYYTNDILKEAISDPVIIHYLAAFYNRPWNINCTHPMKDAYLHYKSLSVWKDLPLEKKKLSTRLLFIKLLYDIFPHNILNFIRFLKKKRDTLF